MKTTRTFDAKVHIFPARALGRGRVARPMLGRLYAGIAPVLFFQEARWIPGPVWTRRSEEKFPSVTVDRTLIGLPNALSLELPDKFIIDYYTSQFLKKD